MDMCKLPIISVIILCSTHAYSEQHCTDLIKDDERLKCYDAALEDRDESQETAARTFVKAGIKDVSYYFDKRPVFKLTAHQPSYFLPVAYNSRTNDAIYEETNSDATEDEIEIKFQLSGKLKVYDDIYHDNFDLWFGYTQTSWWQLYNSDESAPFRETNYSPELFATYYSDVDVLGFTLVQTDFGFVHQSNGRSEPLSRSWNRIYANFELTKGDFLLSIKSWYRIPESKSNDDNPDIEDYVGYGDYRLTYKNGASLYSVLFRNNLKFGGDNKSSVELNWAFPAYEAVDIYFQYYNGYGESLIDYDHKVNRISVGILIYDWF